MLPRSLIRIPCQLTPKSVPAFACQAAVNAMRGIPPRGHSKMAATSSSSIPVPESLAVPLTVPQRKLMGPGPANAPPNVLAANSLPLLGHLAPDFIKVMDEVKVGLQYAWQTKNEFTLAISGTGHAGMEASIINMVERGEVILVAVNGIWGVRASDMAERIGADVRQIKKSYGEVFTLDDIAEGLEKHKPSVFFITQGESSAATAQPLEGVGDLCHKHDCLLIVDTVAAMGGVPLCVDDLGIDVIYSGSQKVLSCPPGTAPISLSPRAKAKLVNRKTKVPSFYFDLNMLANYWGCDEGPRKYHHTGPISSVYALREGLSNVANEGLENCWKRHRECAEMLWEGCEKLGLKLFVKEKAHRLPTITAVEVPEGINWKDVTVYILNKYSVDISGGLGETAGKIWRIGLMGYNCTKENVSLVLRALKDALEHVPKAP